MMQPSKEIIGQRVRNRIIEYFELISGTEATSSPLGLNEIINTWDDWTDAELLKNEAVHPFTSIEVTALLRFDSKLRDFCSVTPQDIADDHAEMLRPEWAVLVLEAQQALGVFRQRGYLSEDLEQL
ncbi:hypothetical protein [Chitinimonas taiwanensis]|uniref:hypothetical protein n=1 Tax=Chitinimonas taiwanensis TaxID=240412 RepID=UPI000A45D2C9|nr:hypothetical protein [Chitinimonas taiwanensis]